MHRRAGGARAAGRLGVQAIFARIGVLFRSPPFLVRGVAQPGRVLRSGGSCRRSKPLPPAKSVSPNLPRGPQARGGTDPKNPAPPPRVEVIGVEEGAASRAAARSSAA